MSVYNDERFLAESMESILKQDGPECEFVIVDDAGTDNSSTILDSYSDPRITLIRHYANRGLAASLNHGLRYCRGKYIARQDGDDVSEPSRIRKQVAFLELHSDISYIGTGLVVINEEGRPGRQYLFSDDPQEIREQVRKLMTPLAHPTLMFRREALLAVGGYDELLRKSEDYDLHLRLLTHFNASNIQEPLVRLRQRRQSMQNGDSSGECLMYVLFAHARQLAERALGPLPLSEEILLLEAIAAWFRQGPLGRSWSAGIHRRMAFESLSQGQRRYGLVQLASAVAEDPLWMKDLVLHGRRVILTQSVRKEMKAIIDRVLGKPDPLHTGTCENRPFPYL